MKGANGEAFAFDQAVKIEGPITRETSLKHLRPARCIFDGQVQWKLSGIRTSETRKKNALDWFEASAVGQTERAPGLNRGPSASRRTKSAVDIISVPRSPPARPLLPRERKFIGTPRMSAMAAPSSAAAMRVATRNRDCGLSQYVKGPGTYRGPSGRGNRTIGLVSLDHRTSV